MKSIKNSFSYCVFFASVISSFGQSLTVAIQPQSQTVPVGGKATFSTTVTGSGPFSYQWQLEGTNLPNGIITTVAGGGSAGLGDGGAATSASLARPFSVAWDGAGDFLIADYFGERVRKVDNNGVITTFAGNGSSSFSGDGGAAVNAGLSNPDGVVVNASGNFYIADNSDNRIRKVDTNGIITTVAGNGIGGYSGDGGPATNASLRNPYGVGLDAAGNLFIADYNNNRIRKVDTNGIITTVAGNGSPGYSGDGGAATNASLNLPHVMVVDATGNLLIVDYGNSVLRKVDTNGIITTVAGNGSPGYSGDNGVATNASLNFPTGVSLDSVGDLFIADYLNQVIREVDTNDIITTIAGNGSGGYSGDGGAATDASLNQPAGVGMDPSGNLFIADASNGRIREVQNTEYPSLTIYDVTTNSAGDYTVIVSDFSGSVTSSVAILQVTTNLPPSITQQPTNQTASVNSTVSFGVVASGSMPLSYQWRFGGSPLAGATNAALLLPGVTTNEAGGYSVVVSNFLGSVTSRVATLTVIIPPAGFQVANTNGTAGGVIVVPILLVANGNENALGFSLIFDTNKLTFTGAVPGSGAVGANLTINTISTNSGKLGLLLQLPPNTTLALGTQQIVQVSFLTAISTNASVTTINFGDQPTPRQLYDTQLNSLPATYVGGSISIAANGYEGDVFPRPNGDRTVSLGDLLQIARYVARLDYPTNGSEYQRADCAPRGTLGNGAITVADWVQVGRYAAGDDSPTIAGGPTNDVAGGGAGPSTNRLVTLVCPAINQGQTGAVSVTSTVQGTENALGFSVAYNPAQLSFVGAVLGGDAGGASLYVNTNQAAIGQLGFAMALGTGYSFTAGTREMVRITFRASASSAGNLPLSFADQPVPREIADVLANALPVSYVNGAITGTTPPVLGIALSGQHITLSWPLWASNFFLQQASGALRSPIVWTNLSATPGISNSANVVTLPRSNGAGFYRLYFP
jgi:hypothetical protein